MLPGGKKASGGADLCDSPRTTYRSLFRGDPVLASGYGACTASTPERDVSDLCTGPTSAFAGMAAERGGECVRARLLVGCGGEMACMDRACAVRFRAGALVAQLGAADPCASCRAAGAGSRGRGPVAALRGTVERVGVDEGRSDRQRTMGRITYQAPTRSGPVTDQLAPTADSARCRYGRCLALHFRSASSAYKPSFHSVMSHGGQTHARRMANAWIRRTTSSISACERKPIVKPLR